MRGKRDAINRLSVSAHNLYFIIRDRSVYYFVVFCDVDMENHTTPLSDQFCMLTKIDAVCDCGELPNLNFLRSGQVLFDCIPYPLCLFRILIFRGRYVNMK